MAKGPAKTDAPPATDTSPVGPPLLLVALGYASILASLPLLTANGIPVHVVGYVTGALIPIMMIGFVRRVDLARRRSPYYVPKGWLRPALVVLAVAAIVAAGLHVWPIATELAS